MGLLNWFASLAPSPAEIRAEVWILGVRHHGHAVGAGFSASSFGLD